MVSGDANFGGTDQLVRGAQHFLDRRFGRQKVHIFILVLIRALAFPAEHQHRNPRCSARQLGHKGWSGKSRHVQRHYHERKFTPERCLIHQNESLSCVGSAYDVFIERFKSRSARVCKEWIVIHKQDRLCGCGQGP